jgi:hypothetical protein
MWIIILQALMWMTRMAAILQQWVARKWPFFSIKKHYP